MPRRSRRRKQQQQQQQTQTQRRRSQQFQQTGDEGDKNEDDDACVLGAAGGGEPLPSSSTATTKDDVHGGGGRRGRGRGRGARGSTRRDDSSVSLTVASAAFDAALAIASGGGGGGAGGGVGGEYDEPLARLDRILGGDESPSSSSSSPPSAAVVPVAEACLDALAISEAGVASRRAARSAVDRLSAALLSLHSATTADGRSLDYGDYDDDSLLREIELGASGVRDSVREVLRCIDNELDLMEDLSFLLTDFCRCHRNNENKRREGDDCGSGSAGSSLALAVVVEVNLTVRSLSERAREDRRFERRALGRILSSVDSSDLYDHVLPQNGDDDRRWTGIVGRDDDAFSTAVVGDRCVGVKSYVARLRTWSSAMLVPSGGGGGGLLPSWDIHDQLEMKEVAVRAREMRLEVSKVEGGLSASSPSEDELPGSVSGDAATTSLLPVMAETADTDTVPETRRRHHKHEPLPVPVSVPSPPDSRESGRGDRGVFDLHERMVSSGSVLDAVDLFLKTNGEDGVSARRDGPGAGTTDTGGATTTTPIPLVTMLLLAGPEGCGKTHVCDVVERRALASSSSAGRRPVTVIRPTLPADLMDENVGASEDALISLFHFALLSAVSSPGGGDGYATNARSIVILDGIHHIVGEEACNDYRGGAGRGLGASLPPSSLEGGAFASVEESHLVTRMRGAFLSMLDCLRRRRERGDGCGEGDGDSGRSRAPALPGRGHILLLCTCGTTGVGGMVGRGVTDRFDAVFSLPRFPEERVRQHILSSLLPSRSGVVDGVDAGADNRLDDSGAGDSCGEASPAGVTRREEMLARLVLGSVGKPAADISKCCRDAVLSVEAARRETADGTKAMNSSAELECRMLEAMEGSLHRSSPESIRGGSLDGVVDVMVETSEDLLAESKGRPPTLSLFGADARTAWEQLESLIVTPLCRSELLDELLFDGGGRDGDVEEGAPLSSTSPFHLGKGAKSHPARRKNWRVVCGGALLVGPPGSGKSVLARYCAASAAYALPSVRLLHVSCTSLVHKEVGGSERAVQATFAAAKVAAPCILVLDGIENIARMRGNDTTTEGTMDRVLSTLLTEMDGIEDATDDGTSVIGNRSGVAVIGITNDARWIDPALRRPNRLEKCVRLDHPDRGARTAIVTRQIQNLPMDFAQASFFDPKSKEDIADYISIQTTGASASEVIAVCNEACMVCIRELLEGRRGEGNYSTQVAVDGHFSVDLWRPLLGPKHFKDALQFRKSGLLL